MARLWVCFLWIFFWIYSNNVLIGFEWVLQDFLCFFCN
jgi:hypothetical protein